MSDSVSKYYEMLEAQEYWASKKSNTSRFSRVKNFLYKLFNYGKNNK